MVSDLESLAAWFGIFCDTYTTGRVPTAQQIRDSMGALEAASVNYSRLSALQAPKGWLTIVNDTKAVVDKIGESAITAAGVTQLLESGASPEVADTALESVRMACASVRNEVQAIAEAVDAMP